MTEVVARYRYRDEIGRLLFEVERLKPKGFRQRRPGPHGGWIYGLGETRRVLYRLPRVVAAVGAGQTVYVGEGEKDVETLERLGKVATTCPMGAEKWRPEYSQSLRGAKVIVIADRDEGGYRHVL